VSANTEHSYPLSIPTASIEVIANDEDVSYVSNIAFDDIIRLQVSIRYSRQAREVWKEIFSGRIIDIDGQTGTGNTSMLTCWGHIAEACYRYISTDVNMEATDIISMAYQCDSDLSRLRMITEDDLPLSEAVYNTGIVLPYTLNAYQKTVKDIFSDIENLSGRGCFFVALPRYDAAGRLIQNADSKTLIKPVPMPTTPTNKYKIIQGTPRLISANFRSTGEEMYNEIIQKGDTGPDGKNYAGVATNETSIARYGKRTAPPGVSTGINGVLTANIICAAFAAASLAFTDHSKVAGSATTLGNPIAQICDLVHIKNCIDVDGNTINDYLRVVRVAHAITQNSFLTTEEFNVLISKPEDYMSTFAKNNRLLNGNFIK
jgi:hypothetical protein